MEKNKKKKAATSAPKSTKPPSGYMSRESAGRISKTDATFQKAFGKSKAAGRKS